MNVIMILDMEEIRRKLAQRRRRVLALEGNVPAAVLAPLFSDGGESRFLLTKRSQTVESHKGQISFPGGVFEPSDGDLARTALREAEEEVGIRPEDVRLLGALDDSITVTGYRVTPFVGVIPYPYAFRPSSGEIDELITVPVKVFLDERNLRVEDREYKGRVYPTLFYDCGSCIVWGATARIIHGFAELLRD